MPLMHIKKVESLYKHLKVPRKKNNSTNLASFHFPTYNLIDAVNCEGRNHRPAWFLQITDYKTIPKSFFLCTMLPGENNMLNQKMQFNMTF